MKNPIYSWFSRRLVIVKFEPIKFKHVKINNNIILSNMQ